MICSGYYGASYREQFHPAGQIGHQEESATFRQCGVGRCVCRNSEFLIQHISGALLDLLCNNLGGFDSRCAGDIRG